MNLLQIKVLLGLCALVSALPTSSSTTGNPPGNQGWYSAQCTNPAIADAAASPAKRWAAVDTQDAWQAVLNSWNNEPIPSGDQQLPFTAYVSNFFHGPEGWNCQDIGNQGCSSVVQCQDTNHPAGYLILNAFSSLHQFHQHVKGALDGALQEMQTHIGSFTSTFAPQVPDDSAIVKSIIDAFTFIVGIGSAFAWNVVVREAALFTDDNYRGFAKDAFNAAISADVTTGKDNIPSAQSALNTQNTITDALGSLYTSWIQVEEEYVNSIFSGNGGTLSQLTALIQNGMMNTVPNDIDLSTMTAEAQRILYGAMIPIAWNLAPPDNNGQILHPFILKTNDPCSSNTPSDVASYMAGDTASQTGVCYNGNMFYVLNANGYSSVMAQLNAPADASAEFQKLPGGTHSDLDGSKFGGVMLDDIVISSYQGYQLNGNKNGYQQPTSSAAIDGYGTQGDLLFQNGIQTPGFFTLTVCEDLNQVMNNIDGPLSGDDAQFWPCN